MGLKIIYGKPGTGKSSYCFSEISNIINKENKIFIITPDQFSLTEERKLMEHIKNKSVVNVEVITLSRMAYRVLNEVGEEKKNLSKCGRAMMIYSILNNNKEKLKLLGKSDENVDLGMQVIAELKKHGITIKKLEEVIQQI